MSKEQPVTMLVSYFPKKGKEKQLLALLEKHWPTLNKIGLATSMPARLWRATDKRTRREFFVEMFEWKNEAASETAHHTPEVMAIWGPMEPILENMQLTRLEPLPGPEMKTADSGRL
jgi:hypothetical protein